jgi:hypothetical protein
MSANALEPIIKSLLFEGCIPDPRGSTMKKDQCEPFTFGRVYPQAYRDARDSAATCMIQTQCLVRGKGATVAVSIRFLQPIRRVRSPQLEAAERRVAAPPQPVKARPIRVPFRYGPGEGVVDIHTEPIAEGVNKLTVRVSNRTTMEGSILDDPAEVLLRTFVSTHTVLEVWNGEFLSLQDPPSAFSAAAADCQNIGTRPVLIGDAAKAEADIMLSSPIALCDYPAVVSEDPNPMRWNAS